jgi:hypothetical protein
MPMNLSAQEITQQLLTLSEFEQQEALDFIEFLQSKSKQKLAKTLMNNQSTITPLANDITENDSTISCVTPIYHAFEQAGLIGCIETDEQLSTMYKPCAYRLTP